MGRGSCNRGWKRAAAAAVMAYVLALQGLLLAFGGALHAAEASGPQTIICLKGDATGQDRAPAGAHDGLCCLLSCHGSTAAGPLPAVAILAHPAAPTALVKVSGGAPVLHFASKVLPLGSRAPPRLG